MEQPIITHVEFSLIREALNSTDEIGIVLRAQLVVEAALVRVLLVKFPNYSALQHQYFGQNAKAFRSLIQPSTSPFPLLDAAECVNSTRNKLAHGKLPKPPYVTDDQLHQLYLLASKAFVGINLREFVVSDGDQLDRKIVSYSNAHQLLLLAAMVASGIDTIPQREAWSAQNQFGPIQAAYELSLVSTPEIFRPAP